MRPPKLINTTLGDLIVALTDEVMPIIRDPSVAYVAVSYIVHDLLAHQHVLVHKRSPRKYPSHFAKEWSKEK